MSAARPTERRTAPLAGFVRQPPPSQPCGAGVTPCGKPARFYPCGWRCDGCRPQPRERPDAETAPGEGGAG